MEMWTPNQREAVQRLTPIGFTPWPDNVVDVALVRPRKAELFDWVELGACGDRRQHLTLRVAVSVVGRPEARRTGLFVRADTGPLHWPAHSGYVHEMPEKALARWGTLLARELPALLDTHAEAAGPALLAHTAMARSLAAALVDLPPPDPPLDSAVRRLVTRWRQRPFERPRSAVDHAYVTLARHVLRVGAEPPSKDDVELAIHLALAGPQTGVRP